MKIVILAVGKMRSKPCAGMVDEYIRRAGRFASVEMIEVRAKKGAESGKALSEGERLLAAVKDGDTVVALDERGKLLSSVDLADLVRERFLEGGPGRLVFIVGGEEGLSDAVRARAGRVLALGRVTFPHELARVLVAEQVYRALTILNNHPYHRG